MGTETQVRALPRVRRAVGWLVLRLGVGAAVALCLATFLLRFSVVRGSSMVPSIEDGDRLVVNRVTRDLGSLQRFDVVILRSPVDPEVDYVKRVVGLPGDMVRLVHGQLWIDDRPVGEPFGHVTDAETTDCWRVPQDSVFVLGDNRPVSSDSREFGAVPMASVHGKVVARVWPPARFQIFP
jgi:signal peptidase I